MNSTRRIALLLTLVFLFPALFFSVYEMSTLSKDEKMIQAIYQKQLDAILFSVNQHADDVLSSWTTRIETHYDPTLPADSTPPKIYDLLSLNSSLRFIFMYDPTGKSPTAVYGLDQSLKPSENDISHHITSNDSIINQLVKYKRSGFQKIERIDWNVNETSELHCLIFISNEQDVRITGLLIDGEEFIQNVVGPKLQTIAQDQFILTALVSAVNETLYSTANVGDTLSTSEAFTKDLWILPGYTIGIKGRGTTMEDLVRERTRSNMLLLVGLDFILITGVYLVFRNLKREVDLAQNKADFVSNVSHEIRTPLALISMFAETLEMNRAPTEEKKQEYYRIISREAQRLSGIVNKILNFSQAEAKKKKLFPERLHIDTEVESILDTYQFHLQSKGFKYAYYPVGEVYVRADREAFTESIINLIDNAVKYSVDTKQIEISGLTEDSYGVISVRDFGVGISKTDQKYIFDKFYRVSSGDLAKTRGTGLGLSLVKQLMEAQEGKIEVVSEPGQGSNFFLYYPLDKETDAKHSAS